mmetsp:Transcript_57128/g.173932  ORF Transcript_57128/g.173932 Transcript_57128/m.173932 type:complete len:309 (-) Transcript_57128:290-1216(-)
MVGLHLPAAHHTLDLLDELRLDLGIGLQKDDERRHGRGGRVVAREEEGQDLAADVLAVELRAGLAAEHDVQQVGMLPDGPGLSTDALLHNLLDYAVHGLHIFPNPAECAEAHPPETRRNRNQFEEGVCNLLESNWEGMGIPLTEAIQGRAHAANRNRFERHLDHIIVHVNRVALRHLPIQRNDELVGLLAHDWDHLQDAAVGEWFAQDTVSLPPLRVLVLGEEEPSAEGRVDHGIKRASPKGLAVPPARLVVLGQHLLHQVGVPQEDEIDAETDAVADAHVGIAPLQDETPGAIIEIVPPRLEHGVEH